MLIGFSELRSQLANCTDITDLDAQALLAPFIEVIYNPRVTAAATFLALSSVSKFLSYKIIVPGSKGIEPAIYHLAGAITHCRFEATDKAEDDAVLLKILALMEFLVCDMGRSTLTDESLCQVFETCLNIACQIKRGDLLRRSAEMTMIKLTEAVFASIGDIEPEIVVDHKQEEDNGVQMSEPSAQTDKSIVTELLENTHSGVEVIDKENKVPSEPEESTFEPKQYSDKPFEPYGLPSIKAYLKILVSIIDPANSPNYIEATRIMALHLLNIAFEVAGSNLCRHESLLELITSSLLKQLLQIVRSDSPFLLQKGLRLFGTVLNTSRSHLKLHQEAYLIYILTCLSPMMDIPREKGVHSIFYEGIPSVLPTVVSASPSGVSTPASAKQTSSSLADTPSFVVSRSSDAREVMVEALSSFSRMPSYFVDLFVNYDCDVDRADLSVDLINSLCRNAYPDSAAWSSSNVPPMCLETILSFLNNLANRIQDTTDSESSRKALENKARKKLVIEATERFNEKPADGLALLVKYKLIPDDKTINVVKFLRQSGRINKKLLGEFLAKPKSKEYLDLFIKDFDFSHKSLDEAMRELFAAFRLPGESQQIERIIEKFAEHYVASAGNKEHVADKDSAFVLSYAVIMLNTDLHNPQVKQPMKLEEFKRNLRKTNAGGDFAPEYLENIYYTIKHREIIIPEEHDNEESFEHAWKDIQVKSQLAGDFKICSTNEYDKILFESTWQPIATMLSYVFATATDDTVFSRVIKAFEDIARISQRYHVPEALDQVLSSLCKVASVSEEDLHVPTDTVQIKVETRDITVSKASTQLGNSFGSQMALVLLFQLSAGKIALLKSCWENIVLILANIYLYSLTDFDLLDKYAKYGISPLPPSKPAHVFKPIKPEAQTGLFSTLSSYITGNSDYQVPEPPVEDVEATLSALECLQACNVASFIDEIFNLPKSKRLDALVELGKCRPTTYGLPAEQRKTRYPASLFVLDIMVLTALESQDPATMRTAIVILRESLEELEQEELEYTTRILSYHLALLRNGKADMATDLEEGLEFISQISSDHVTRCMPDLIDQIIALCDTSCWCSNNVLRNPKYWNLLRLGSANGITADVTVQLLNTWISNQDKIWFTNFQNVFAVFGQVCDTGSSGARLEQDKQSIYLEFGQRFSPAKATKKGNELIALIEKDVERSVVTLETAFKLRPQLDTVASEAEVDWMSVWSIYASTLLRQCTNPCRKIRQAAFKHFQKAMEPSSNSDVSHFDWSNMFTDVLFPNVDELLTDEVYQADPTGMVKTRGQVASLSCKLLLQFVTSPALEQTDSTQWITIWTKTLDIIKGLISSHSSTEFIATDASEDALHSLKNLLMVIKTSGLQSEIDNLKSDLFWDETWKRVDVMVPELKSQLEDVSRPE